MGKKGSAKGREVAAIKQEFEEVSTERARRIFAWRKAKSNGYDLRTCPKIVEAWELAVESQDHVLAHDGMEWNRASWVAELCDLGLATRTAENVVTQMIGLGVLEGEKGSPLMVVQSWSSAWEKVPG